MKKNVITNFHNFPIETILLHVITTKSGLPVIGTRLIIMRAMMSRICIGQNLMFFVQIKFWLDNNNNNNLLASS
jgi:hypothetical protein